ncbi:MAG: N-acetyltransferase [Candidatus Diapherotrites archaeon]
MTAFIVRKIRESDALGLSLLFPEWGISRAKKEIKKTILKKSNLRLVAEKDSLIVGHIMAKPGSAHHSHIATLYSLSVEPSQRRQGIATELLHQAIKLLPSRTEIVLLQVQADNKPAKKLFEKMGFTQYGYLKNAFKKNGVDKDNILMCKFLSKP